MISLSLKTIQFINENSCFDLQFRRDVKYKRQNKPVYFAWKAQFIIMGKYQDEDLLREIQNSLACGRLHFIGQNKIRYSVQRLEDLYCKIAPFLKSQKGLFSSGKRRQDFELWARATEILFQNKGKEIRKWKKEHFLSLIKIQKEMQDYKIKKIQGQKWLSEAEFIAKALS